ncbi:MAG: 5-methyltetrahydropteroyltriglutamate--homocysteine S-methyltransferase [Betaproteobacteria bacterium]|nr:5-methyltetrahydropteroyltriglutamate--homocysteine S-methyltransferase [Betaproteobacteria bacterium]
MNPPLKSHPPFRAEHIGSLVRPTALVLARREFEAARIDQTALRAAEDEAIRQVVALQESVGLQVVTDGEFRRGTYSDSFTTQGIRGVSVELTEPEGWKSSATHGHRMARRIPRVVERIVWNGPQNARDFAFLKSVTNRVGKFTLPGPGYIHYRAGRQHISQDVYPNLDAFWSDLVAAYHQELQALADAGCTYVQIDETSLVKFGDPRVRELLAARGDDWQKLFPIYIDAVNAVIDGAPKDMTVGVHVCRSQDPSWQAAVGYDPIAEALFHRMKTSIYYLEYDDLRSGGFEPLRQLPRDKKAVLGLVHSRKPELESVAFLKQRIDDACRYADRDQFSISPQCGFATGVFLGDDSAIEAQRVKLARVVEVAREVWGQT